MSRTVKTGGNTSPIKKYLSFSGSTGNFSYYDKNKKENVQLESIDIIVLDVRSSITGYNESLGVGISSNLILNSTKEKLKVVSFVKGAPRVIAEGLYQDIKSDVKDAGGKFTTNVICLADVGDGQEIVNLQLSGSALNSWIDFAAEHPNDAFYDYVITISKGALMARVKGKNEPVTKKQEEELDAKLKKNPRMTRPVWFYVLEFNVADLTEEEAELASEEDGKVQAYFKNAGVVSASKESTSTEPSAPLDEEEDEKDDLPF